MATHGVAVRTLPEQIADDLGAAIARGDFAGGERLLEIAIAQRYGVSRGPVREALRLLALRGLAVLYPRRGAFVVEVSLDSLVDLFNMRAVLMGLATRYFAIMASEAAHKELQDALAELTRVSKAPETDSLAFTAVTSRISGIIFFNCHSESLARLIEHQNDSSAWRSLWQSGRIDFETRERRREAAADYQKMGDAIEDHDGAGAEAAMRHLVMRARESAVAALSRMRGETYDERRLIGAK
jgi:DNA-binding GntR family transcriptional regulator